MTTSLAAMRFAGIDGDGVQQLIGAHVEDDEVFALGIENYEPDAGGALGARADQRGVHSFRRIEVRRDAGELVGCRPWRAGRNERRAWPSPRPGSSPLPPGPMSKSDPSMVSPKIGSLDALYGHADREAADDRDYRILPSQPPKTPSTRMRIASSLISPAATRRRSARFA